MLTIAKISKHPVGPCLLCPRTLTLTALWTAAFLLCSSVSARADNPPEPPMTEPCPGPIVEDGGYPICGTLNPSSSTKVSYYFAYDVGSACTGGAQTAMSSEVEGERIGVSSKLSGLTPDTKYSYCLVATNAVGDTFGNTLSFRTARKDTEPTDVTTLMLSEPALVAPTVSPQVTQDLQHRVIAPCTALQPRQMLRCRRLKRHLRQLDRASRRCKKRHSRHRRAMCRKRISRKYRRVRHRYRALVTAT